MGLWVDAVWPIGWGWGDMHADGLIEMQCNVQLAQLIKLLRMNKEQPKEQPKD